MALTAISEAEVAGTTRRTLSDEEAQRVVAKEAKKRRESAQIYTRRRPAASWPGPRPPRPRCSRPTCRSSWATAELAALVDEVLAAEGL